MVSSDLSGVQFINSIPDSDSFNIMNYEYIYNGGGVGLADFNSDGFLDIFFAGNLSENKLYLNKGNFVFEDVSEEAGIQAATKWCQGITTVDINQDGRMDLFVTVSDNVMRPDMGNLLFVNVSEEGGPTRFEEKSSDYGLAGMSHSTQSVFFDYDNDGDLDLIVVRNKMQESRNPSVFRREVLNDVSSRTDVLYECRWEEGRSTPYYVDVSKEAGITVPGFSLGVNVCDINEDGWKDIYITNDFISEDILYINQRDGTFRNEIKNYFKHTSLTAMGNEISDINNDGRLDVFTLDMYPEWNERKKTLVGPVNYNLYLLTKKYDYIQQVSRNTLQLGAGMNPHFPGQPIFSEVALYAGIEATDWSWCPLVSDFDGDGLRDLIVTNGFPKDITDRDFADYKSNFSAYVEKDKIRQAIPEAKLPNYAFRNLDGLKFENCTHSWGMESPSFSTGASYGDLDNDGGLDLVISNINHSAHIYKNKMSIHNFLKIKLQYKKPNIDGYGTVVKYTTHNINSLLDHNPSRGYLSSVSPEIYLGLGGDSIVDLDIKWPNGEVSCLKAVPTNQTILIDYSETEKIANLDAPESIRKQTLLSSLSVSDDFRIPDFDFPDYNFQPLFLQKFSEEGPGMAVGDIDNNGYEDVYVAGSGGHLGKVFYQVEQNEFILSSQDLPSDPRKEELGVLLFDVDADGDLDLYIVSGSNQYTEHSVFYKDELLLNEKGRFHKTSVLDMMPPVSGSCVRAADYDRDGRLDLFVGGRMRSDSFPLPPRSFLLRNLSSSNGVDYEDVTFSAAPGLGEVGMVTNALWTDFNNDGWVDLIVVGEWMPITFYQNIQGVLTPVDVKLNDRIGWWKSIASIDVDQNGIMDYVVLNHGENTLYRASNSSPMELVYGDYDSNGKIDAIPFLEYKSQDRGSLQVPFHNRDDLARQMVSIKKKYRSHREFAIAGSLRLRDSLSDLGSVLHVNEPSSFLIMNPGDDASFDLKKLPAACQMAPGYSLLVLDIDGDGMEEILIAGNDYGAHQQMGPQDAMNGVLLRIDATGGFIVEDMERSGFFAPGNSRSLVFVPNSGASQLWLASNNDDLRLFELQNGAVFSPEPLDCKVVFRDSSDKVIMTKELSYGSGFLSQSSRKVCVPPAAVSINIYKYDGSVRKEAVDMRH